MDRNIRAFIAIAKHGNVTLAARDIGMAQSSLTKKLRQIEIEFGASLFERLPRGMRLTTYGQALHRHAIEIERSYSQAKEEIVAIRTGHVDLLRIGAGPSISLLYMSRILDQLRSEFPKTQLILSAPANLSYNARLLAGDLDVVVGRIEAEHLSDKITTIRLATFEHCLVIGDRKSIARDPPTAVDLLDFAWIGYSESIEPDPALTNFFHADGLAPPPLAVSTSSFNTALELVAAGRYAMIVPNQFQPIVEASGAAAYPIRTPLHAYEVGVSVRSSTLRYPIVKRLTEILEIELASGGTDLNRCQPDDFRKGGR
ncbi:LysR family transcriptional regulator [Mesorhizobium sp. WSM4307]|uniref:LysR family transcriptional regulator n=1 Tax=unclassified Mesorhizobium TaxID=325217 RepID=UPI000BB03FBE|nr:MULTISPECIES: LysR family transcriptional regulator [unclassified Mesorhizobium]PBB24556.1 LysR family transcriptional regulator [Mesorhizobium sp. WSM4304]PBB74770.1 LysR family transcriptional regulator [Mesorhizobium sp. WSM4308]TRC73287.1 LysR family transcriptional regulator [Mesorhizobium sp. WSM4315]TRC83566.1 LysR family transcriptional regulator [Mesorhizobium sp. WSM4307]